MQELRRHGYEVRSRSRIFLLLLLIASVFVSAYPHAHFEFAHAGRLKISESETGDAHEHLTEKILKKLQLDAPAILLFEKIIVVASFVLASPDLTTLHWRPPLLFFAAPRDPPTVSII